MLCQGCHRSGERALCRECYSSLRLSPDRMLPGPIHGVSAFVHTGVAAQLVHDLKYRGLTLIVDLGVDVLAQRLGRGLTFCPVPRVWTRYLRYGIDPAGVFAERVAKATDGEVDRSLLRPLHSPRRAGSDRNSSTPPFRGIPGPPNLVLVDDVATSGATILAASRVLGDRVQMALTITSAAR